MMGCCFGFGFVHFKSKMLWSLLLLMSLGAAKALDLRALFIDELWNGDDPLRHADKNMVDKGYGHTNLKPAIVSALLKVLPITPPLFWVEVGSMLGGSVIVTAKEIKAAKLNATIVAIDPFTGDVSMWASEKASRKENRFAMLRNTKGHPTIYDRFRANVVDAGHADMVVPIVASSIVGMKLLAQLYQEKRIPKFPEVLYLDSAHEEGETLLELRRAWDVLPPGGVLFGDDFNWTAVQTDVHKFVSHVKVNEELMKKFMDQVEGCTKQGNDKIVLCNAQWLLFKPAAHHAEKAH